MSERERVRVHSCSSIYQVVNNRAVSLTISSHTKARSSLVGCSLHKNGEALVHVPDLKTHNRRNNNHNNNNDFEYDGRINRGAPPLPMSKGMRGQRSNGYDGMSQTSTPPPQAAARTWGHVSVLQKRVSIKTVTKRERMVSFGPCIVAIIVARLPSDNVQNELQHRSLINTPRKTGKTYGNSSKKKKT